MKKILALVMAVVMAFSIAAVPASAAVSDSAQAVVDSYNAGDYEATVDNVFTFARDLAEAIHALVGGILGVLGKECPFCEEIHSANAGDDNTGADDECTCEGECTCGKGDKEEEAPLYETAYAEIGAEFANKDMSFNLPYPQNVDAAYVFTAPTKSIAINGMATANVKTAIILAEGATTGKIVFTDNTTYNYFHAVEGFKLLINNSGASVAIVLAGDVYVGKTLVTAANIGDYVEGPYTVSVAA